MLQIYYDTIRYDTICDTIRYAIRYDTMYDTMLRYATILHDRNSYTTTNKCLQCLIQLMYTVFWIIGVCICINISCGDTIRYAIDFGLSRNGHTRSSSEEAAGRKPLNKSIYIYIYILYTYVCIYIYTYIYTYIHIIYIYRERENNIQNLLEKASEIQPLGSWIRIAR